MEYNSLLPIPRFIGLNVYFFPLVTPFHHPPTLYSPIPPLEIRVVPKFLSTLSFSVPYRDSNVYS